MNAKEATNPTHKPNGTRVTKSQIARDHMERRAAANELEFLNRYHNFCIAHQLRMDLAASAKAFVASRYPRQEKLINETL